MKPCLLEWKRICRNLSSRGKKNGCLKTSDVAETFEREHEPHHKQSLIICSTNACILCSFSRFVTFWPIKRTIKRVNIWKKEKESRNITRTITTKYIYKYFTKMKKKSRDKHRKWTIPASYKTHTTPSLKWKIGIEKSTHAFMSCIRKRQSSSYKKRGLNKLTFP